MPRYTDGHEVMRIIYDELGIKYTPGYHQRQDANNLAHTWNRGKVSRETLVEMVKNSDDFRAQQMMNHLGDPGFWDGIKPDEIPLSELEEKYGVDPEDMPDYVRDIVETKVEDGKSIKYVRDLGDVYTFQAFNDKQLWNEDGTFKDDVYGELETKFIDEMWGTKVHDDPSESTTGKVGTDQKGKTWGTGDDLKTVEQDLWGLDIKRDWSKETIKKYYGKEELEVGSDNHYEWSTRGLVDWDYYQDGKPADNKWIQTHKDLGGDDKIDTAEEIRDANKSLYKQVMKESGTDDSWKHYWDGKYKASYVYDPNNPEEYEASYLDVTKTADGKTFDPGKKATIATTSRTVSSQPDITGIKWSGGKPSLTNKHTVTKPANIPPSFGEA